MNNSVLLADIGREVFNNWTILFYTIVMVGFTFFLIGLVIGHRFWNRFRIATEGMKLAYDKRHRRLLDKRDRFDAVRNKLESIR